MTRNTVRRVEVATPILDENIKNRLVDMFDLLLSDNKKARHEDAEGNYRILPITGKGIQSQELLYEEAYKILEDVEIEK